MQSNVISRMLQDINAHDLVPLIFVLLLCLVGLVAIVCGTVFAMHKNRLNHTLKRELLERGLSAAEIATIISAKPGPR